MLLIIGIAVMNACHHDPVIPTTPVTFEGDVKPIILNSCARTGCHVAGGEDPRLTSYKEVMEIVKAGKPQDSKLYEVITALSGEDAMPPDGPLSNEQLRLIYIWILQGAKEK